MKLLSFFHTKAMPAVRSFFWDGINSDAPATIAAYAREGYALNPIAFTCINVIARAAASVKLEVHSGNKVFIDQTHDMLKLLAKPNPTQSGKGFIQEMITSHRIAGEVFILRLPNKGKPTELYILDPRHVTVEKPKDTGTLPVAFTYGEGENKKRYPVNQVTGASQVLHIKTVNPLDPWRGLSPMSAAARAVDIHNAGGKWNAKLLQNSARPSGIIEMEGDPSESMLSKLREYFKRVWQGADNAGELGLLTGGAKFTAMSMNAKDMDFIAGLGDAAKNIALVFGVPLPLITNDAATFSNMETAMERLWIDTVLPLLDEVFSSLSDFLSPLFDGGVQLTYNADSVPALEARRERLYKRMGLAVKDGIITIDEARDEMGFDPAGGDADTLGVNRPPEPVAPAAQLASSLKAAGFTVDEAAKVLADEGV